MTKKQIIALALVAAVALFFLVKIIRNALTSEEAKIKKLIRELASDFEEKKIKSILKHVADDHGDTAGNTKQEMRANAQNFFFLLIEADVSIKDVRVEVFDGGRTAVAVFSARARMTTKAGDFDLTAGGRSEDPVRLRLKKEKGDWLIYWSNLGEFEEIFLNP